MIKLLVTGGRTYFDREVVDSSLDQVLLYYNKIGAVIHGDANGVDALADDWAWKRGIQQVKCPANWTYNGKAAGPIRNRSMLVLQPDLVVAFPGGTGTADMKKAAAERGIRVWEAVESGLSFEEFMMKQYGVLDFEQ